MKWYNENEENKHATGRQFGIGRKRIRDWVENVDFLRQQSIGASGKKRKLTVGMPPMSEELDQAVLDWLQEERAAERFVRNKDLQKKALQVATLFKNVPADFKASNMWLSRWN